jgi:hypothetical protein
VARAVFILNVQCRIVFSLSDEKYVHLMGQPCPVHLLRLGKSWGLVVLSTGLGENIKSKKYSSVI